MADTNEPSVPLEAPMQVWVRGGGTSTTAQDNQDAARRADTEERRKQEEAKFKIVRERPHEAHMHSMALGGKDTHAAIVLELKHPKDNTIQDWITCELSQQPLADGTGMELLLILACPRCIITHGRPTDESQLTIRESNRKFYLDSRPRDQGGKAGELWVNPKDPNEVVTLAGTVTTEDWITCPACNWKFKIDASVVHTR